MKIKYQSAEVPEETMRNFAIFLGWTPQVMTTTESPNYAIDNPQSFSDFIIEKYSSSIQADLIRFNLQEAEQEAQIKREEADEIINTAKSQAEGIASSMFQITIE